MCQKEDLNQCVSKAIRDERRRVHRMREANPTKKHKITDYAAAVVACGYAKGVEVFPGKSASPLSYQYTNTLKNRLEAVAQINNGCQNLIGACAEPHAADKVLRHYPGCKMNELRFTKAYRPRTAKSLSYCQNCKDTFPEVL